jgi:hypothetical protein
MATSLSPMDVIKPVPPGISWTAPPKGRSWNTPPRLVKIDEIAQGYITNLSSADMINSILDVVETKVPLASMAEALMLSSVHKGIHTIDAGILVMPVIIEMLKTAADMHGVVYTIFSDELTENDELSPRVVRAAIKKASEKPTEDVEVAEPVVELSGLMSKKPKMENM